ncbi:PqqC-like protein [Planktothrix serta PCC 8927]|uniref:PqqC-like protein n=1 Tax=Planktothrix serta PCC 8927 TaxID=671068 RepID=A0A7Z9BPY2_9CYAN|nr:CADD family putative folate metabolism protein [Planktothrix serta]VXD20097.1 PqqC-like protein [Planktothrix serta PCC 8927]
MLTQDKPLTETAFLAKLNEIIETHHLLKHPFYQMWNQGKLTLIMLQEYAQEYYLQVHNFPTYVSATHAACDDINIRKMLLENLIEEERGSAHHPELWLRFAEGLGVERSEVLNRNPLHKTQESVRILKELSRSEEPEKGLAALYAYESQFPQVSTTKIAGLEEFYGINEESALSFFKVHEKADEIHSQMTRKALLQLCQTTEKQEAALDAAQKAVDAFNLLLDGVYEEYCQN